MRIFYTGMVALAAINICLVGGRSLATEESKDSKLDTKSALEISLERLESYRAELHRWDRVVRGFRLAHNFTVAAGRRKNLWRYSGTLLSSTNEDGDIFQESIRGSSTTEYNMVYGCYTFHIPIGYSWGYYLGSSVGFSGAELGVDDSFQVGRRIQLPGLVVGVVWSLSPAIRLSVLADGHMVRFERVSEKALGEQSPIFFHATGVASEVTLEFFYQLGSALRVSYVSELLEFRPTNGASGEGLGLARSSVGSGFMFGYAYHMI